MGVADEGPGPVRDEHLVVAGDRRHPAARLEMSSLPPHERGYEVVDVEAVAQVAGAAAAVPRRAAGPRGDLVRQAGEAAADQEGCAVVVDEDGFDGRVGRRAVRRRCRVADPGDGRGPGEGHLDLQQRFGGPLRCRVVAVHGSWRVGRAR